MKLLESSKFKLPKVYFVTDRLELKEIPIGVPFIYGHLKDEKSLIRILEYETLYQEALKSGYPFNFKKILSDNGYLDLIDFSYSHPIYMEFTTEGLDLDVDDVDFKGYSSLKSKHSAFSEYVRDSSAYVDIEKLKNLNVFPLWLDTIEKAVHTNIHNFAVFNNNMYNKKLEGMYGGIDLVSPSKNLIIIDISGSIPKAVSSTTLAMAKNLAETFYADLIITGSKSTLYHYECLSDLNIHTIYEENGMDNDQVYFRKIVTEDERSYKTAIVFGDNHSPGYCWSNSFNKGAITISKTDGQKLCKWKIEKLISFHTQRSTYGGERPIAGYAEWFTPDEIEHVEDWVKYLN